MRRFSISILLVLAFMSPAFAGKDFTLPHAANAITYPAHDSHPSERVTIAIDPYDSAPKSDIFKVNWRAYGYLPVFFIVSNDSDRPIALTGMKVSWMTANRSKIVPATGEDLARRLSRVYRRGDESSRNPFPVPLPRKGPDVGVNKATRQEIDTARFQAMAVEPHTTRAGFLFFDVQDIREPVAGANVYITGITNDEGQELMYFEVPLDKYVFAPAAK